MNINNIIKLMLSFKVSIRILSTPKIVMFTEAKGRWTSLLKVDKS